MPRDRRTLALIGVIAGTLPWVVMILIPTSRPRRVNLDPVHGLVEVLTGDPRTAVIQMGGNLAVFAAFGAFGPMRWRLNAWQVTAIAAAGSLVLELLQYVLDLGRVSAVDDVVVNALGAGLAAMLTRRWRRRPDPRSASHVSRSAAADGSGGRLPAETATHEAQTVAHVMPDRQVLAGEDTQRVVGSDDLRQPVHEPGLFRLE